MKSALRVIRFQRAISPHFGLWYSNDNNVIIERHHYAAVCASQYAVSTGQAVRHNSLQFIPRRRKLSSIATAVLVRESDA